MDPSLWAFLQGSPEQSVPYPWERCFDVETQILMYKNRLTGAVILDLRPRVNLGGGLYNVSDMWFQLTDRYDLYPPAAVTAGVQWPLNLFCRNISVHDQDTPIMLCSTCCTRQVIYLLVPHVVTHCPLCGHLMGFFA
ncbi:hypothetical protein D8674_036476 [Pyrus ussuriensis x Pyrus communis]|uniref:Uncharacterized protein n=1 Tax=Pyrus ussuriensis x Pyrus communis TaxID=2448454 RepID=A0A5N5G3U1_9ROSA|nr:hypothetical protein D8674_018111 [Pyrus ussuriensis x Pyrus communis]KAB2614160.1 hypothetical protein D8674_036476 [Pyrus ussuriensis x Pyrus communis]